MHDPECVCDVAVIGGGLAGLVAACRAAQLGKHTVVLERGTEPKYPCNTRYTYGTLHVRYATPTADEDDLYRRITDVTEGFARPDLARAVARHARRLVAWLVEEGVELIQLGQYHTHVLSPVARTGAGLKWEGYAGDVALERLESALVRRGGRLLRGTRARSLHLASPRRIEVAADQATGPKRFVAQAVVVADGGFQANADLVRAHISPAPEKLLRRYGGESVGDGLRMTQEAGAMVAGLPQMYGHLHSREALHDPRLWPRPLVDELASAGILVDAAGKRFADEGHGGIYLSNAVARLADPLSATIVFDQPIWDGPGRDHVQPANPLVVENGGTLHVADALGELAAQAGLPPANLQQTVDQYNAALEAGALDRLAPSRRTAPLAAWPIRTPPFYAMPVCSAITNTMGGIVVDGDGAVLNLQGAPIPGLFAAGATIGSLDGGPHAGYVGGLIKAVLGLLAAEKIAEQG